MDKIEVRDDEGKEVMRIIDGKVYRLVNDKWVEEKFAERKRDEENGSGDSTRSNDET